MRLLVMQDAELAGLRDGFWRSTERRQLGHSLQMFDTVYADWIRTDPDRAEVALLERAVASARQREEVRIVALI